MLANTAKNILTKSFRFSFINANKSVVHLSTTTAESNTEEPKVEEQKVIDPAEFKALEEKLAKSEADVMELKDKYMRALAETENVRNRMIKVIKCEPFFVY